MDTMGSTAVLAPLFKGLPTSVVSDCMGRLAGTHSLHPQHGPARLLGTAFTVRVRAGDNLFIHEALRQASPGSVIVVDAGGSEDRALIGEIMMAVARKRGIAGFVVDGAVRDVSAFREAGFPCFARGVTHRGPYKNGPGEIGGRISVDGCSVETGDIVIGDEDGVLFIDPRSAEALAEAGREKLATEAETLRSIEEDRYDESWIEDALARSLPVRS